MTGVIWFVQVVHYPLFSRVGVIEFVGYEEAHQRLISFVVIPLMVAELATAIALVSWLRPMEIPLILPVMGLVLLAGIWLSTFLLQVPQHDALSRGFDIHAHWWLVATNWIRTIAWTARSVIVLWMVALLLELYR